MPTTPRPASPGARPAVELRRARIEDAEAISDLVRRAYTRYVPRMGREPIVMRADCRRAVREHQVWLVHDEQGLAAVLELIPGSDHLLIENVAVRPDRQRQGIGRQLLDFVEGEAVRQGLAELRLYTNETMVENRALYASLGYHETHPEPHDGTEIVFMSKRIAAAAPATASIARFSS